MDWETHAYQWIEQYALTAYRAQHAAHLKEGRRASTFRYTPDLFHQRFVEALGLTNDHEREHTVKAMMLYPVLYRD